jgi:hypothetical protein
MAVEPKINPKHRQTTKTGKNNGHHTHTTRKTIKKDKTNGIIPFGHFIQITFVSMLNFSPSAMVPDARAEVFEFHWVRFNDLNPIPQPRVLGEKIISLIYGSGGSRCYEPSTLFARFLS